jgi:hypothetical protein
MDGCHSHIHASSTPSPVLKFQSSHTYNTWKKSNQASFRSVHKRSPAPAACFYPLDLGMRTGRYEAPKSYAMLYARAANSHLSSFSAAAKLLARRPCVLSGLLAALPGPCVLVCQRCDLGSACKLVLAFRPNVSRIAIVPCGGAGGEGSLLF